MSDYEEPQFTDDDELKSLIIVVAHEEPMTRMALVMLFGLTGIGAADDSIHEADSLEEIHETLEELQDDSDPQPILVLVGDYSWVEELRSSKPAAGHSYPIFVALLVSDAYTPNDCEPYQCKRNGQNGQVSAVMPVDRSLDTLRKVISWCENWWKQRHKNMSQRSNLPELVPSWMQRELAAYNARL